MEVEPEQIAGFAPRPARLGRHGALEAQAVPGATSLGFLRDEALRDFRVRGAVCFRLVLPSLRLPIRLDDWEAPWSASGVLGRRACLTGGPSGP
jgi:hypothetical protein